MCLKSSAGEQNPFPGMLPSRSGHWVALITIGRPQLFLVSNNQLIFVLSLPDHKHFASTIPNNAKPVILDEYLLGLGFLARKSTHECLDVIGTYCIPLLLKILHFGLGMKPFLSLSIQEFV